MLKTSIADLAAHVGTTLGPTEWVAVGQDRIDIYADAVSDHNWIHCDVPRATASFGGTIAHGLLTLSLAPAMSQSLIEITDAETDLNYGFDKVRFLSVVHGGERVRLHLKILEVFARGEGTILRMEYTLEVEGKAKPAVVADWLFMLFPKPDKLAAQAKLAKTEAAETL